jgi:hypothetical protein
MNFVRINNVAPLEGFRVRLTLTNGSLVERDLSGLLRGPVFEEIRGDPAAFRQVRAEHGTLVWPNGADLCPDVIIWGGPPPEPSSPEEAVPAEDPAGFRSITSSS